MEAPTCEQILDEDGLESVSKRITGTWRHGTIHEDVWKRTEDGTFWRVRYRYQHNAEDSDLRDGTADIHQVWPVPVTVTHWSDVEP